MPFQKGRKKTGGRIAGVSVASIKREVAEKLAALGCDPIEGMAKLAQDPESSPELQGKMNAELAKYVHPQRKAVELSGPGGTPVELQYSDAGELLRSRIAGIAARRGT